MPLSEKLLNSLICPACHKSFRRRQDTWECLSGHTFDEINGVPILRDTTDMGPFPEGNETTGWYKKLQWQRAEGLIGKIRNLIRY